MYYYNPQNYENITITLNPDFKLDFEFGFAPLQENNWSSGNLDYLLN